MLLNSGLYPVTVCSDILKPEDMEDFHNTLSSCASQFAESSCHKADEDSTFKFAELCPQGC